MVEAGRLRTQHKALPSKPRTSPQNARTALQTPTEAGHVPSKPRTPLSECMHTKQAQPSRPQHKQGSPWCKQGTSGRNIQHLKNPTKEYLYTSYDDAATT